MFKVEPKDDGEGRKISELSEEAENCHRVEILGEGGRGRKRKGEEEERELEGEQRGREGKAERLTN